MSDIVTFVALYGCASAGTTRLVQPQLDATPGDALVDMPVAITLHRFAPDARITVGAATPFEDHVMRASATYVADDRGEVDVATTAPEPGSDYEGADRMGLFWSMQRDTTVKFAGGTQARTFAPPDAFTVTLTATGERGERASTVLQRRFIAPGVEVRDIAEAGVITRLHLPAAKTGAIPVVITLTGSEGGYERLNRRPANRVTSGCIR